MDQNSSIDQLNARFPISNDDYSMSPGGCSGPMTSLYFHCVVVIVVCLQISTVNSLLKVGVCCLFC